MLQASSDPENKTDYYLNAMVAGNRMTLSSETGIASAESSIAGTLEVNRGSDVTFVPAAIRATEPTDEIITVKLADGTEYHIHTINELMPVMKITGSGVGDANKGVYTFAADKFLLRVSTAGELLYYRNMLCTGECMAEGFAPQVTANGVWYSLFVELRPEYRNANGGFSSGMYLIMDENYTDVEELTLLPSTDPNHTHGAGYLDQHELVMLGEDHYLLLSYTAVLAENLPDTVRGIDGGHTGYVWENIFQEVKDGKVVNELNTADYPLLYDSAVGIPVSSVRGLGAGG